MCATLTLSLFMFLPACLSYGVLHYLQTFHLTVIQIGCIRRKLLFFSKEISFCRHKISFFFFKLSKEPKLAEMLLIFVN